MNSKKQKEITHVKIVPQHNTIFFSIYGWKIKSVQEESVIINLDGIVIRFHWTFSILCPNIFNESLFLVFVSNCIRSWVRLSVMLIPVSFSLFLKSLFLILYLANLIIKHLGCLPFLRFPIPWLWSKSSYVSFSSNGSL